MDALKQFLGGLAFLFVAALLFSFMREGANFGSVADWAGAGANLAVVILTLWLATAASRREARARSDKVIATQKAFRDCLKMAITLGNRSADLFVPPWPNEIVRDEFKYDLHAVNQSFMQFPTLDLPIPERLPCNHAEAIWHTLSSAVGRAAAQSEMGWALQFDAQSVISISVQRLEGIAGALPPIDRVSH
ncbi:hypothetical protein [Caulobacter sp. B11]|uniref:hypothetical protein n=1 Tax=Caulobacter sp. B11 TaxID=2048899 RepID=UPI00117E8C17|nr:hypothetical protein [Caulobacter sp. B11]